MALAGGLVVAGADRDRAGGVPVGGEAGHVGAELGDDHLAVALGDAGNRGQQLSLLSERGQPPLDVRAQCRDRLVEVVEMGEVVGDDQ